MLPFLNFSLIAIYFFAYTGITWCSYKILTFLKRSSNSLGEKKYRELNIQITRALIAQVLVPCVLTFVPTIFYVFAIQQKLNVQNFNFFMNLLSSWIPVGCIMKNFQNHIPQNC
uniref:Uncharacterized protein n=1 Tax=Ditylenchus dipsaci TaxID=166011 RepID=A0A915CPT2_9BILA